MNEHRGNAMLQELARQRNEALDRCALMAAEIAELQSKINELMPKDQTENGGRSPQEGR